MDGKREAEAQIEIAKKRTWKQPEATVKNALRTLKKAL